MLSRLRLTVPDAPGSLGRVTSALGAAGVDVVRVDVLECEAGRALDDVLVQVRDDDHRFEVVQALAALPGVSVVGTQRRAPATGGHAELELLGHVLARPGRALATLVDGAPGALGADWAAAVDFPGGAPGRVLATSTDCPGPQHVRLRTPLRLASVPMVGPGGAHYGGAALAPLGMTPVGLVVVREEGPAFHRTEVWRLGALGAVAAHAVVDVALAG